MWKQRDLRVGQRYLYGWNRMGRKGQLCTLEIIGRKMNSVQVRFDDDHQAITSANALKRIPDRAAAVNDSQPLLIF